MCRYGIYGPYKQHYACFNCRKSFKYSRRSEVQSQKVAHQDHSDVVCPECNEPMTSMGLDFKAPKQQDVKQWKKVELLAGKGFVFNSCGCSGPGYRPKTLREVPTFLAEQRRLRLSPGERLLEKIVRKKT